MTKTPPRSIAVKRRIDQLCEQFESAWRDEQPQKIETFLDSFSNENETTLLLKELLARQLLGELRRRGDVRYLL